MLRVVVVVERRVAHDVGHFLEEQAVVALNLGKTFLHNLLFLEILAQMGVAFGRLIVDCLINKIDGVVGR